MKTYLSFGLILLAGHTTVFAQKPAPEGGDKILVERVTLTGCVTAGMEKDTYVLSDVRRPDMPVGTSGRAAAPANVVYWLDSPEKLRNHVGHLVEVQGVFDDDVDRATVKPQDDHVKVTSEHTKTVEVPEGTRAAAAATNGGGRRIVYKVKVGSVKMLAATCRQ